MTAKKTHHKSRNRFWRMVLRSWYIPAMIVVIFGSLGVSHLLSTRAATSGWLSGASGDGVANGSFATWRGTATPIAGVWGIGDLASGQEFGSWNGDLDVGVWGAGTDGTFVGWSSAASGGANSYWDKEFSSVKDWLSRHSGHTIYMRFAYEYNGGFMPYNVKSSDVQNYITAFRAWATKCHAITGCKTVWANNDGSGGQYNPSTAYPGSSYVDVVGVDTYNQWPWVNDTTSFNSKINTSMGSGATGIEAWRQYALSVGKPMSIPEWGNCSVSDGGGGGDAPNYIQNMYNWMSSHAGSGAGQVLYDVYFNVSEGYNCNFWLYPNTPSTNTQTAAMYKSLTWGNGGLSGTTTTTPTPTPTTGTGTGTGTSTGTTTSSGSKISQTGNLLTGKTFTSSAADSTTETGHPKTYINDGNESTRWISTATPGATLTVDLGSSYALTKLSILWAGDTTHNYEIQTSSDGSTFTTVGTNSTNNTSPQLIDQSLNGTVARYLRIHMIDLWNSSYGNSIWEMGLYGSASTSGSTGTSTGGSSTGGSSSGGTSTSTANSGDVIQTGNLLTGKVFSSTVADSTTETGHPASMITDGNGSTRWISQPQSPVNLTTDLGATYTLNKLSVKWAGDTIKNYQLQISKDNSTWTSVYAGATSGASPNYTDYTSFTQTPVGRYLRIVGTDRWNSSYGNSIWEAGAYGTSAPDTTKPSITMTAPTAGAAVSGSSVAVTGVASDNVGVSKVELLVDGAVVTTNTSSSANFTWNSKSVGDGNHTIAIRGYDAAGNTGSSSTVTVGVHNTTSVPAPTIQSFAASPSSVTVGGTSTLSWATQNASSCSVTPGGPQNSTATSWQTPALTTTGTRTYTLDCQNSNAQHVTKTASLTVNSPSQAPGKPTFAASATTIVSGDSVTLSWSSTGAQSCTLNPGNISSSASSTYVATNLKSTTTFTLSCSNSAGSTDASPVTVTVKSSASDVQVASPTIVSFTATPSKLSAQGTATLSWVTSNVVASGCNLSPSPLTTTNGSGSWTTPVLTSSESYTLTCVNSEGASVSKSLSVVVADTPVPDAPDATLPPVNDSDDTDVVLTASNGEKVVNASTTDTLAGLATFDPSNVTNSSKQASIVRVEYYSQEKLLQSVSKAPFVLDTTKLKNGVYTITERTYFTDGSQHEVTRVVTVKNAATKVASKGFWSSPILWSLIALLLLAAGFFIWLFIWRRRSANDGYDYPVVDDAINTVPNTYSGGTPDWQQGVGGAQSSAPYNLPYVPLPEQPAAVESPKSPEPQSAVPAGTTPAVAVPQPTAAEPQPPAAVKQQPHVPEPVIEEKPDEDEVFIDADGSLKIAHNARQHPSKKK